jgi:hypothetical protein
MRHDYNGRHVRTIADENPPNPRLARKTRDQSIKIMKNLDFPMPDTIGEAIVTSMRGSKADG